MKVLLTLLLASKKFEWAWINKLWEWCLFSAMWNAFEWLDRGLIFCMYVWVYGEKRIKYKEISETTYEIPIFYGSSREKWKCDSSSNVVFLTGTDVQKLSQKPTSLPFLRVNRHTMSSTFAGPVPVTLEKFSRCISAWWVPLLVCLCIQVVVSPLPGTKAGYFLMQTSLTWWLN